MRKTYEYALNAITIKKEKKGLLCNVEWMNFKSSTPSSSCNLRKVPKDVYVRVCRERHQNKIWNNCFVMLNQRATLEVFSLFPKWKSVSIHIDEALKVKFWKRKKIFWPLDFLILATKDWRPIQTLYFNHMKRSDHRAPAWAVSVFADQ